MHEVCTFCSVKDVPNFKQRLEYDEKFAGVKVQGRRPTDLLVCFLFVAFLVGMIVVAGFAFWMGDPRRVYYPTDYMGRVCGFPNQFDRKGNILLPRYGPCIEDQFSKACEDRIEELGLYEDLSSRPYLWFMDISQPLLYGGVCVEYCPRSAEALEHGTDCPPSLVKSNWTDPLLGFTTFEFCAHARLDNNQSFPPTDLVIAVESQVKYEPLLKRCAPALDPKLWNSTERLFTKQIFEATEFGSEIVGDVFRGWIIIIVCTVLAVVLSYEFLIILRFLAFPLIWFLIILCWVVMVVVGVLLFWWGRVKRVELIEKDLDTTFCDIVWVSGCVCWGFAVVYALLVLILFGKIRRAIGILQEATMAVGSMPQVAIFPAIIFVFLAVFYFYWLAVAFWLWSSGNPKITDYTVHYKWDYTLQGVSLYHVFGFFWVTEFCEAFIYVVVSGAIASWYWSRNKKICGIKLPVAKSAFRALVFHLGTIAFGALVVAAIRMVRFVLKKLHKELQVLIQNDKVVKGLIWAANTLLKLLEIFVKYVNKHSYIQTATYGTSFIASARNAMSLIIRNAGQVAVVDYIGTIVLWIAKLVIALICVGMIFLFERIPYMVWDDTRFHMPILVIPIVFITSFLVASIFMSVLECTIDTILQSFLMDQEMCESNPEAKPFCTGTLKNILWQNRKLNELSKCFGLCDCLLDTGGGCCNTCI